MNKFLEFCKAHRFTVIFVLLGVLLIILFFSIGFWKTIVSFVVIGIFFVVGFLLDQSGSDGLKNFFSGLFSHKK